MDIYLASSQLSKYHDQPPSLRCIIVIYLKNIYYYNDNGNNNNNNNNSNNNDNDNNNNKRKVDSLLQTVTIFSNDVGVDLRQSEERLLKSAWRRRNLSEVEHPNDYRKEVAGNESLSWLAVGDLKKDGRPNYGRARSGIEDKCD